MLTAPDDHDPNVSPSTVEEHVRRGVRSMEPMRARWLVWNLCFWIVTVALGGSTVAAWSTFRDEPAVCWTVTGVSALAVIILGSLSSSCRTPLYQAFDTWRAEGVRLLDSSASFAAQSGFSQSDFDRSGLNGAYYNGFSSWSLLSVGSLRASALSVKHTYTETYYDTEYHTDSRGRTESRQVQKKRTVTVPIFDGIMLIVPAPLPRAAWILLRHHASGLPDGVQKIDVASPFLAETYAIGASDPFAGHRALTPSLMEALEVYCGRFRSCVGYSYRDDLLYITIPNHYLGFGERPGKWSAMTALGLRQVLEACQQSIASLQEAAERLKPT